MRIGNNNFQRHNDLRIDSAQTGKSKPTSGATPTEHAKVDGDVNGLVRQLRTQSEDRSSTLAAVRERLASGAYLTPESAEQTADALYRAAG